MATNQIGSTGFRPRMLINGEVSCVEFSEYIPHLAVEV